MTEKFSTAFPGLSAHAAVEAYLEHGPTTEAAVALGVHLDLFRKWVASSEGRRAIDLARSSLNALLDLGLTKIINQASARVLDALEHGQKVISKDGEIHEIPISGKDAATIFAIVFDRRQLLRKQPTQIGGELDEKLEELATKLRYLGSATVIQPETLPVDMPSTITTVSCTSSATVPPMLALST